MADQPAEPVTDTEAEVIARRLQDRWITPLWLSHHWPEDYDRCLHVGRWHLCRRCTVLYPLAAVVTLVAMAAGFTSGPASAVVVVLAPLPAVIEFVAEHLGILRHAPLRLVTVTVGLAVGLGVGFARYLADLADPVFWIVVILYTAVCGLAALWGWRHR